MVYIILFTVNYIVDLFFTRSSLRQRETSTEYRYVTVFL